VVFILIYSDYLSLNVEIIMPLSVASGYQDNSKRVTIDLPKNLVDLVDKHCRASLATRRKWFYDAMLDKLKKDEELDKKEVLRSEDT
jgi:hypothetical protein